MKLHRLVVNYASCALICCTTQALMLPTAHAQTETPSSGTNTLQIMAATVSALPSCLSYQVTGVCFFLKCYLFYCEIEYSIRVSHYMPDVVVSTYNDPVQHPWTDIGKPVASFLSGAGSSMMGSVLDSTATTARESQEVVTFKSADALGNPVGAILGGTTGTFEFADTQELMNFPSQELPKIAQQWAMVPVDLGNGVLEGARAQAMNPGAMLGQVAALPGQMGGMLGSMTGLGSLGISNPLEGADGGRSSGSGTGSASSGNGGSASGTQGQPSSYQQMLDSMYAAVGNSGGNNNSGGNGNSGASTFICPGGAGLLSVHYNADLDSLFWRGKVPLELLYPASWVPGVAEVGNGLINTWGGTYPRTGELVQSHPVKSSAVLAARVGSIIRQSAQPHIYKKLAAKGERKYIYFARVADPRWQAVYPTADSGCITFGTNDSLGPGSYGDFKTSGTEGYIWNLWHRYECCERKTPIYLFAVP